MARRRCPYLPRPGRSAGPSPADAARGWWAFAGTFGDSTVVEQRLSDSRFSTTLDLGQGSLTLHNDVSDARLAGSISTYGRAHDRSAGYELIAHGIRYHAATQASDEPLYDL